MSAIRRSIAFSALDRYASIVIGIVTSIILARLLTPKDFGVFSIAMSFVLLTDIFRYFGIGTYLLQIEQLTNQQLQVAFTTVLTTSALAGLILLLATPAIAAFYGDAQFWQLMPLLALNMMLGPFSLPGMALLQRKLAFDTLAGIGLFTSIVYFIVVVGLASLGYGVVSLAYAKIAFSVVTIATVWIVNPCFAAFRISLRGWREPFQFGLISVATTVLNFVRDHLPSLIVGRTISLHAVGLFGRATTICQLPDQLVIGALSPVLLPTLSRQAQAGVDLKPFYLLSLCHMSALQWPILLCLALLAEPMVLILYGQQWIEVAPLARILALSALATFPAFMTYPTLVAIGRMRDILWLSLISLPTSVVLVFVASPFGLEAVAATQFISAPFQVVVALSFVRRRIGVSWGEIAGAVRRSAVVAACSAAAPASVIVLRGGFGPSISHGALAVALVGAAAGWLSGVVLSGHPLRGELGNGIRVIGRRLRLCA